MLLLFKSYTNRTTSEMVVGAEHQYPKACERTVDKCRSTLLLLVSNALRLSNTGTTRASDPDLCKRSDICSTQEMGAWQRS